MRDIATATLSGNLTREVELEGSPRAPTCTAQSRHHHPPPHRRGVGRETNYFTVEVYGARLAAARSTCARARAYSWTPSSTGASGPTRGSKSARR